MADLSDYLGEEGGRVPVDLDCRIIAGDDIFPARLSDLSCGGARVTSPGAPKVGRGALHALDIEGLGALDVVVRWRRGRVLGLSFPRDHVARPRIAAFLVERGLTPGPRA